MAKKTKNLGIRATEADQKRLRQIALDRNTTVQALYDRAIEAYLESKQTLAAPDLRRREQHSPGQTQETEIVDRLDTLLSSQKDIQDEVRRVLREITKIAGGKGPMAVSAESQSQSEDEQVSGVPLDIAELIDESTPGPERPGPAPKARPKKPKKTSATDPGRRTH